MKNIPVEFASKIAALYPLQIALAFIVLLVDAHYPFLNGTIRNVLGRFPYQWDHEFFFASLCIVWGIFLWKATVADRTFLQFSIFAFWVQGIVTVILALLRESEALHLIMDSIPWFLCGTLLYIALRAKNRALIHK